ncbi:MAG: hypothetical protein N2Z68_02120 [Patescibacteria group bacterium]|nr:hypothetical protein [Patescibacteria group bacterium]
MSVSFLKKIGLGGGFFLAFLLLETGVARASEPLFIFSWKALNFAPSWYPGKVLPVNQTKIIVSFEAISTNQEDYGKVLNLDDKNVIWFVNGVKVAQGKGLKSIVLTKDDFPRSELEINIKGEYQDNDLSFQNKNLPLYNKHFYIPLTKPEITLSNKKIDDNIKVGEVVEFKLIPFFFNVENADFLITSWRINDNYLQSSEEDRFSLRVEVADLPPTGLLVVTGAVENLKDRLETVSKSIIFNVY